MFKYYLLFRGPGPGALPQRKNNLIIDIEDYGERKVIEEIGHHAWGFVEYQHKLTNEDIYNYELVEVIT